MSDLVFYPKDSHSVAVIAIQLAAPNDPQEEHFKRAISILESADYFVSMRHQERYRETKQREEASRRSFNDLLAEKAYEVEGGRALGQIRKLETLQKKIRENFANRDEHARFKEFDPDPDSIELKWKPADKGDLMTAMARFRIQKLEIPFEKLTSLRMKCRPSEEIIKSGSFEKHREMFIIEEACHKRKSAAS